MLSNNGGLRTQNPDALRSFVRGQDSFKTYWGSQAVGDLQRARTHFASAERADSKFALASFYVAVTDNELRQHDAAIEKLEELANRAPAFLPEVYVHLAFAYTKRYTDPDYDRAEDLLDQASRTAAALNREDFLPVVDSYRAFLFAVIGGRSKTRDREEYLQRAIALGKKLVIDFDVRGRRNREAVLVEAHNALGISYMRQGERSRDVERRQELWQWADREYLDALHLRPNAVRVTQNRASLRMLQGDAVRASAREEAVAFYRQGFDLIQRTIDINPNDPFPHFRAAHLLARLDEWELAAEFVRSGREHRGAVKDWEWASLIEAIDLQDARLLFRG